MLLLLSENYYYYELRSITITPIEWEMLPLFSKKYHIVYVEPILGSMSTTNSEKYEYHK